MQEDLALGHSVIHHRTLVKSFENILDACVELEGARDPSRLMEVMNQAGDIGQSLVGSDGDLHQIAEMFESEQGKELLRGLVHGGIAKLKIVTWAVVDHIARIVEKDPDWIASVKQDHPDRALTRKEMQAWFDRTVSGWLEQERPELIVAARTQQARHRLDETRISRFQTRDWWGVASVLLDGPSTQQSL